MILYSPLFYNSLVFTLKQALFSSVAATFVGLLAAPGYSRLGNIRKYMRWILLTPTLMSPVLVILALLVSFEKFPFGMTGIILGHVFLNAGLATVWIGESWTGLEAKWAPVFYSAGGNSWFYFKRVMLPLVCPSLFSCFVVIFSFCISSFALPLIFGGGPQNSTLEVLIYERLRAVGDYQSAVILAFVQCGLQIILFEISLRSSARIDESSDPELILRNFSFFSIVPLGVAFLSILPFLKIFREALQDTAKFKLMISAPDYLGALSNSIFIAAGVSLLSLCFLSYYMTLKNRSWLTRIPTVSGVVVALGILLLLNKLNIYGHLAFILALVFGHLLVIGLPVLRLSFPKLNFIASFYSPVAVQLGASRLFTLRKVLLKLGSKTLALSCLLAFLWSLGEFSVSRVLSGEYLTLPLYIENLISSYRLELASLASLVLLGSALIVLFCVEAANDEYG